MSNESVRRRAGFTEHLRIQWQDPDALHANNIVLEAGAGTPEWLAEATGKIGDWRSVLRDVYLRWAITINAMHLARDHWRQRPDDVALRTVSLRSNNDAPAELTAIAVWPARIAEQNYERATPILSAYGIADMFGAFEEIIFELYLVFLNGNPLELLRGHEFRELRRLYGTRLNDAESGCRWEDAWADRLNGWRRKRLYDGLHQVLRAFFDSAELRRPSWYQHTDIDDWCRTIEALGELRNLITHGEGLVSERLARLSQDLPGDAFRFEEGAPLNVTLQHLMFGECFGDQLLTTINVSLVEKVMGPLRPN